MRYICISMKRLLFIFFALSVALPLAAQKRDMRFQYSYRDVSHYDFVVEQGDTLTVVHMVAVPCFSRPMDMRRYWKLVRDFRAVWPLAQVAKYRLADFEARIMAQPSRSAQKALSRRIEKALLAEYTPTIKKMTISQGKILIRLIDRETELSSYDIIKEFRGGFVAGFWQGIAKMFGHNLKDEYDPTERDRVIEQCVRLQEAGLLPSY